MGFYREHVLPRILNKAMDTKVDRQARQRVCEGLHGQVVEIGFGSGLNAPFYPAAVTKVMAIEPSKVSMQLAQRRVNESPVAVEYAGLDGQRLDLPSGEFDAVLSTWTLCSIPDPRRRAPGGSSGPQAGRDVPLRRARSRARRRWRACSGDSSP